MATEQQIDGWIEDLVKFERTQLPRNHSRYLRTTAVDFADLKRLAKNARMRLVKHGALPKEESIVLRAMGKSS